MPEKPLKESAPSPTWTDAPRAQVLSDIADFLADALRGTDEAFTLASEKFGETDEIAEACLNAWAEVETAFRLVHPSPGASERPPIVRKPLRVQRSKS